MNNLLPSTITKPHIDLTLIQQKKHNQQPHLPKTDSMNKYSDHPAFYTDGSKNIDRTGAAATNINNYKQIKLPNNAFIYSAELQAIKMALDIIKNSEMGKSIIFSDSLFSLIAIQEGNQNHPYIQEILEIYHYLINFGKTVILAWVPSHVGKWLSHLLKKQSKW